MRDSFGGQAKPCLARMPRLSSRLAAGALLDDGLGCVGRIGGGRDGRIGGVLSESGLEIPNLLFQVGDAPKQFQALWTGGNRLAHTFILHKLERARFLPSKELTERLPLNQL